MSTVVKPVGKVYLVGAGLGSAPYLTLRAQQLLAQAEVLVYDALVDPQLLQLAPPNCTQLNVGKRGGQPSLDQSEIDQLLVEQCQQGKQVVRLKSGDPFIFGRSTSEIHTLIAAGCSFEVVPGISSALAAPLLAGIPLTDPVLSSCFAVLSAHDPTALDWQALARIETLVILMGGRNLPEIVNYLEQQQRSLHTPVAIIRWAGRPQQQVWIGTLATIVSQTAGVALAPAVIVIGEVVGLRNYLQFPTVDLGTDAMTADYSTTEASQQHLVAHQSLLLRGKTVLITRSVGQSSQFSDRLQQAGATVIEMPALEIGPPSSWEQLDSAISQLQNYDWLILTSTNGVDYFFERLRVLGKDARALAGVKIAVVGDKTAQSLKQYGLRPDFIPPDFVADSLATHFPDRERLDSCKILFPRVESGGREVLVAEFKGKGAKVTEVPAYQSRCPAAVDPAALAALQNRTVDVITFASSKTVKHFCQLLEQTNSSWRELLAGICLASIGPQTSEACRSLLGRVDVEAQEYTLEGLTQAIERWVQIRAE